MPDAVTSTDPGCPAHRPARLLAGRSVLVTGGGSGLGRAVALLVAAEGGRVVVADIDAAAAGAVVAEIVSVGGEAHAVTCDVADEASVQASVAATVQAFGRLDAAVNNAAVPPDDKPLVDLDLDHFDRLVEVNLRGVATCMKHQARAFRAQGHDRAERGPYSIVNVGSTSSVRPRPNNPGYVATKHGIVGLTKSGAVDLAEYGVRVNAVLPGGMETPMIQKIRARRGVTSADQAWDLSLFGRLSDPTEVAEAVVWLSGERASYVTGALLAVDAGYLAR